MDPPLEPIRSISEFKEHDKEQGLTRIYDYRTTTSEHYVSACQEIDIIESMTWGKMLFMNGTLQSTTRDEVMYHTTLVHPLLDCLSKRSRVLILGGGEGATAREVLRWKDVLDVTMVDYDRQFVEMMRATANGYAWSRGAFADKRLHITYADAWEFMTSAAHYNAVIVDLTDPDLDKNDWKSLLYYVFTSIVPQKGGFVMNAGPYIPWDTARLSRLKHMVETLCLMNRGYKYYIYTTYIPSFHSEWTFIAVAYASQFMKEPDHVRVIPEWIRRSTRVLENTLIDKPVSTIPDIATISANSGK